MISAKYEEKLTRTDEGPASKTIGYTPSTEARQHVGSQENYSQQTFQAWRIPGCIAVAGKHYKSSEGNSNPRRELSGNDQDSVERLGQDVVVGGSSKTGEAHHLGPVLEGFL